MHSAAMSAWMAGQIDESRAFAEAARVGTADLAVRAEIDALRGRIAWNIGSPDCGQIVFRAALDVAAVDNVRALEMAMLATSLVAISGDPVDPAPLLRRVSVDAAEPRTRCLLDLLTGHSRVFHGDLSNAAAAFRRAFDLGQTVDELDMLVNLGLAALLLGDDDNVRRNLIRIGVLTRDTGAHTFRLYVPSRFDDVRATPWAERARQELRASGETARKRDVATTEELTPQEMQIARLASHGMSNRDIASQCYLSVRTVEFHLSNAYTKPGIRSRGELAQLALT